MQGPRKVTLLGVFAIAVGALGAMGKVAIEAGPAGISLAGWVLLAILMALLLATLASSGGSGDGPGNGPG